MVTTIWRGRLAVFVALLVTGATAVPVAAGRSSHWANGTRAPQPDGALREALKDIARYFSLMLAVPVITTVSVVQKSAEPSTKIATTFKQMASLVGEWEAVQNGAPVKETYTLTANGSALMAETKSGNDSAMMTMFTVDGDRLVATHYCVAGNQPQMVADVRDDLQKGVTFSLVRVTGMKTPDDWHNTALTIILADQNHMTQRWTYLYKGKTGTSVFHYTRKH